MDEKILLLINRTWTNSVLDWLMAAASSFDAWAPVIAAAVIGLLIRGGFRERAFIIAAGLLVALSDGGVAKTLKQLVGRPRPNQVLEDIRVVTLAKGKPRTLALLKPAVVTPSEPNPTVTSGRSFPSSHTMNTMVVAVAALAFFGARAWGGVLVCLLVAYSRVYTGSHWPSDVLVSLFLGIGTALLGLAAMELTWRKKGARLLPRIHAIHPTLFTH